MSATDSQSALQPTSTGTVFAELTVEALLVRNIVYQQYAHRTSIVRCGDRPESLLARGIPYLQLDPLAVQLDRPYLEVDANGGDEGRGEGVFAEAKQAAGFTHAGVAYEEEFDKEVLK